MTELTGQYSHLYTRKFQVSYTDWQPSTQTRRAIDLFSIPNGFQVVACMVVPIAAVVVSPATACNLRICQSPVSSTANSTANQFAVLNAFATPNTYTGVFQWVQPKLMANTSPQYNSICNKGTSTTIQAVMDIIGGGNMNSMSAGSWYVYVTYIRLV